MGAPQFYLGVSLDVCDQRLTVLSFGDDEAKCLADSRERDRENPVYVLTVGEDGRRFCQWLRSYGVAEDDVRQIVKGLVATLREMLRKGKRGNRRGH